MKSLKLTPAMEWRWVGRCQLRCFWRTECSVRQRPWVEPQISADAVGAGETAKGHGIEPLAREAGIAYAIEMINAGAVERHRQ